MRLIQRLSAWLGWTALLGIAVLLILEGTAAIGAAWRGWIGDAAVWMTQPTLAIGLAVLVGVVLGLAALAILVAQFVPLNIASARRAVGRAAPGPNGMLPIAIRRAAVARLKEIDGVVDAVTLSREKRRLSLLARMDADADASKIEQRARTALDESFFSTLGAPPIPIDLTLTYSKDMTPSSTTT